MSFDPKVRWASILPAALNNNRKRDEAEWDNIKDWSPWHWCKFFWGRLDSLFPSKMTYHDPVWWMVQDHGQETHQRWVSPSHLLTFQNAHPLIAQSQLPCTLYFAWRLCLCYHHPVSRTMEASMATHQSVVQPCPSNSELTMMTVYAGLLNGITSKTQRWCWQEQGDAKGDGSRFVDRRASDGWVRSLSNSYFSHSSIHSSMLSLPQTTTV